MILGIPLTKMLFPSSPDSRPISPPLTPVPRTLLPSPDDVHPLDKSWTLSFRGAGKSRQSNKAAPSSSAEAYSHGLFTIFTASTVEDLLGNWKAFRRRIASARGRAIEPIGQPIVRDLRGLGMEVMDDDTTVHFFVKGIKPMWEDPMCAQGGKLMMVGPAHIVSIRVLLEERNADNLR